MRNVNIRKERQTDKADREYTISSVNKNREVPYVATN